MTITYDRAELLPASVQRIRDSEEGVWRRIGHSDDFMPEFAGSNMTLDEIIDHFGPVADLDEYADLEAALTPLRAAQPGITNAEAAPMLPEHLRRKLWQRAVSQHLDGRLAKLGTP
jgi:hypothetical protein